MGKRKQHKVEDIMWSYTKNDWIDWISDILKYEVAYPIYTINRESENVLMDMPEWLIKNKIDTGEYQKALIWHLKDTVDIQHGSVYNIARVEKLLESLDSIRWDTFIDEKFFIDILMSIKFDRFKLSRNSLKNELLSILVYQNLSSAGIKDLEEYVIRELPDKINETLFWEGYLRVIEKVHSKDLMVQLNALSIVIDLLCEKKSIKKDVIPTIIDTINEFFYNYQDKYGFERISQIWRDEEAKKPFNKTKAKIFDAIDSHYLKCILEDIF